jgi:L-iditol 2-dehydrogenase
MKQVELHAPEDIRLQEAPVPSPGPDEVLIKIACVGICGSDLHAYHNRHPFIELPVVPGHEFCGTVAEVGPNVTEFAPGQRVTVEPSLVCGKCYNCLHGRYNICEQLKVIGCQSAGAMAEYLAVPATKVLALPDDVSFDQAALAEPLAVGVHAVRVGGVQAGTKVLVLGAGTIGLMTLQAANAMGATPVMVTDTRRERLDLAMQLGADEIIDPTRTNLEQRSEELFGHPGPDVIIECVGSAATIKDAIAVARKGTRIVVAGVFEEEVPVPLGLVQDRELEIVGTLMYAGDDFQTAIDLLAQGQARATPLITHRFPLDRAAEAFKAADSRDKVLKVLIEVDTE